MFFECAVVNVGLMVFYGGVWDQQNCSGVEYVGGRVKSLLISNEMSFEEFVSYIYSKFGINIDQFQINLNAHYDLKRSGKSTSIEDEDDFQFLIHDSLLHPSTCTPITVSIMER